MERYLLEAGQTLRSLHECVVGAFGQTQCADELVQTGSEVLLLEDALQSYVEEIDGLHHPAGGEY